jgi:hypothetical protein
MFPVSSLVQLVLLLTSSFFLLPVSHPFASRHHRPTTPANVRSPRQRVKTQLRLLLVLFQGICSQHGRSCPSSTQIPPTQNVCRVQIGAS